MIRAFFSRLFGKKNKYRGTMVLEHDASSKTVVQIISGEEYVFNYTDFADLKSNVKYDRFHAGGIVLTSGTVVCGDPFCGEHLPQLWEVGAGSYDVYLYIALLGDGEGRVAYAELVFKDEIPSAWEMSLVQHGSSGGLFETKMNGMYPVDSGLSCFADYETFKAFEKEIDDFGSKNSNGNYYFDVLEKHFQENANIPESSRGEDWINYTPVNASGNIIMFATGWGDGVYPRYVGYSSSGDVLKMVTDFYLDE